MLATLTPALGFLLIALLLIATELLVMQFSFFWFFFVGLAALITALVCWIMPDLSWTLATALFLLTALATVTVLFPVLKRWQNRQTSIPGHDAIGQSVKVLTPISSTAAGRVLWSGSEWSATKAGDEADFKAGESAIIRQIEGISLIVGRQR